MVKYISKVMATGPFALQGLPVDHSIDVPFELAKTIFMMPSRGGARFDKKLQRVIFIANTRAKTPGGKMKEAHR